MAKRGAPYGNKNATGNKGGAPIGNTNAIGNKGGGAPRGNINAIKHGLTANSYWARMWALYMERKENNLRCNENHKTNSTQCNEEKEQKKEGVE